MVTMGGGGRRYRRKRATRTGIGQREGTGDTLRVRSAFVRCTRMTPEMSPDRGWSGAQATNAYTRGL